MSLPLGEVLKHPDLSRAEPDLLTGDAHTSRTVRWVHSSEVLDIGPLLRGGELLLTGGSVLCEVDAARQRAYIRDLAAHGVTAVAVEVPETAAGLPDALIDEAVEQDFALIRLERTVPFVAITEAINGVLVNASVRRLRLADSLSDSLSARLTSGADAQQLAETLADATGAGVAVREVSGEPLASADVSTEQRPDTLRHAPIALHGVTTALLELRPSSEAEEVVLQAAMDRAPQAFGLALLRTRPSTPFERARRALFRALDAPNGQEVGSLLEASGLGGKGDNFVAVTTGDTEAGFRGMLEQAMRRGGRAVLSRVDDDGLLALVTLESTRPEASRRALVDDVRRLATGPEHPVIGVGPLVTGGEQLGHTVTEARHCLHSSLRGSAVHGVVDAAACSLQRMVHGLDADEALERFVREQLAPLLRQPPDVRHRLLRTLEVFFDCAANKTEAAQRLHLRRQTLYQRLDKLSVLLGHSVTGSDSLGDLQVAVRLRRVLDTRAGRDIR